MKKKHQKVIHSFIEQNKAQMIEDLANLIRIPSVKNIAEVGKPFGKPCADALQFTLDVANRLGLYGKNTENYIGYVTLGSGKKCFGILTHLDVVPEGNGWDYPPFGAHINNNIMYGRGTLDDKAPVIASLYALAAIKNLRIPIEQEVRLILGCDEESGWQDIDHYKQNEKMPDYAFSPDANYPVVNTEKGILHLAFKIKEQKDKILHQFESGTKSNVVPGQAISILDKAKFHNISHEIKKTDDLFKDLSITEKDGHIQLTINGFSAHASQPEKGNNAAVILIHALKKLKIGGEIIDQLTKYFSISDYYGKSLGIAMQDEKSGHLTANLGKLDFDGTTWSGELDVRYPISACADDIEKMINQKTKMNFYRISHSLPHHVSEKSDLVQSLLKAYSDETHLNGYCIAIGGGTYARALDNAVSFGCLFPHSQDLMHQPNESICLDEFILNAKIIAAAIMENVVK